MVPRKIFDWIIIIFFLVLLYSKFNVLVFLEKKKSKNCTDSASVESVSP